MLNYTKETRTFLQNDTANHCVVMATDGLLHWSLGPHTVLVVFHMRVESKHQLKPQHLGIQSFHEHITISKNH